MLPRSLSFVKAHPILITILIVFFLLFSGAGYLIHWAFYDMDRIPQGDFLSEKTSPDGKYSVKTYRNNGGATVNNAVLGVLVFNEEDKKTKNIYWQYDMDSSSVEWEDNDTVIINEIRINVPNEKYDYRHP